jgi:cytochrome oxidase Cu insertion factor (SCO1/SenC/PrrC family)
VKAFSDQHGLSKLKNWYFLTGSPSQLKKIWKAYGIAVIPTKTGDVQHTSALFFVNSKGKEVYLGRPQMDKLSAKEWSQAISFILKTIS